MFRGSIELYSIQLVYMTSDWRRLDASFAQDILDNLINRLGSVGMTA